MPDVSITTNLMGFYEPLDYQKWAKEMDFISWDNYTAPTDTPAETAAFFEFVTTYFSGIVDKHDLVIPEGYPGRLRDILGIWVEENELH